MQIHFGGPSLRAEWPRSVVCVGTFDGVHRGHQAVISEAVARARSQEIPCVLVTFDRHPAAILSPSNQPKVLATHGENLALFEQLGVSVSLVLAFDAELSRLSAERFLEDVLRGKCRASEVVVGHDFACGNGREGTAEWLADRIPTTVVSPFELDGIRVSSSLVRKAVSEGEVRRAHEYLGRPFSITGTIIDGEKLGRQLGYPTANFARSADQVIPADAVYAAWCDTPHGRFAAAVAIGTRPAVGGRERTIEAFLLDYPGQSLYGTECRLEFLDYVRSMDNFPGLDALIAQMGRDVERVREIVTKSAESTSFSV